MLGGGKGLVQGSCEHVEFLGDKKAQIASLQCPVPRNMRRDKEVLQEERACPKLDYCLPHCLSPCFKDLPERNLVDTPNARI